MGAPVIMIDTHDCGWHCNFDTVLDTEFIYDGPYFTESGYKSICALDIEKASLICSAGGLLVDTSKVA